MYFFFFICIRYIVKYDKYLYLIVISQDIIAVGNMAIYEYTSYTVILHNPTLERPLLHAALPLELASHPASWPGPSVGTPSSEHLAVFQGTED